MPKEAWQSGAAADGRGIVLWVPSGGIADVNAPTAAELTAGTVKRITYGLAADGFVLEPTINSFTASRYTGDQELESEGTKNFKLTLKWVYNRTSPTAVETALGTPDTEGYIVQILGYPNDHTITDGVTICNAVVPVRTGTVVDVPPVANSELMKTMVPDIIGAVGLEVLVGGDES